jgi:hypothetical protein
MKPDRTPRGSRAAPTRRDREHATSLLWILTSFDAFDLLYTGLCLSADSAAEILIGAAERALCR